MNNLDERIRAALAADSEEAATLAKEPGLWRELFQALYGRNRWISLWAVSLQLVSFGLFLWTAVEFYQAAGVSAQLRWGGAALFLLLMISFMKVWFWLEMQSNRVLRELKRVELLLVSQSRGDGPPRE
ncbi:MAG: DUF6768 family protein [Opitutales bacterium]